MDDLTLDALERDARKVHDMRGPMMSADPADILALITRLRATEARTAWQPIETCPRGEWVLLWWPPHGVITGQAHATRRPRCTHWQPLPAPPASEVPRG